MLAFSHVLASITICVSLIGLIENDDDAFDI